MNQAITPKALAKEAKIAYQKGEFVVAAEAFQAASRGFFENGDHLMAAEMANNCSVAFLKAGDGEAALIVVEGTPEVFAHAGDLVRQGMALSNCGAALEALDRFEEAENSYNESAEILGKAGEDKLRLDVLQSLSALQFRTGRQLQALYTMQDGVNGVQKPNPKQKLLKRLLRIPFDMTNKK